MGWRTRDGLRGEGDAWTSHGPRMDPWGGAPEMGYVVKVMRGPRMDPAWTRGVAPNGPETAPNGLENGRNRSISPNTYKIGQFEAF